MCSPFPVESALLPSYTHHLCSELRRQERREAVLLYFSLYDRYLQIKMASCERHVRLERQGLLKCKLTSWQQSYLYECRRTLHGHVQISRHIPPSLAHSCMFKKIKRVFITNETRCTKCNLTSILCREWHCVMIVMKFADTKHESSEAHLVKQGKNMSSDFKIMRIFFVKMRF